MLSKFQVWRCSTARLVNSSGSCQTQVPWYSKRCDGGLGLRLNILHAVRAPCMWMLLCSFSQCLLVTRSVRNQNVLVMQNEQLNLFHQRLPSGYEWHKSPYPALVLAVLTSYLIIVMYNYQQALSTYHVYLLTTTLVLMSGEICSSSDGLVPMSPL